MSGRSLVVSLLVRAIGPLECLLLVLPHVPRPFPQILGGEIVALVGQQSVGQGRDKVPFGVWGETRARLVAAMLENSEGRLGASRGFVP